MQAISSHRHRELGRVRLTTRRTSVYDRAMPIRFKCVSCDQPIEVDDGWASKMVACPYCRQTVTAPATSTFEPQEIPMAAPVTGLSPGSTETYAGSQAPIRPASNKIALVALVLSLVSLGLFIAGNAIFTPHIDELEALATPGSTFSENMEAQRVFFEKYDGVPPPWFLAGFACVFSSMATWLAATICAIIALRRPMGRTPAVASLVLCGILMILGCGGMIP